MGNQGNIKPLALHLSNAEWNRVGTIRNLAEVTVEKSILHEADGIIITDGSDHEPLRIVGSGRTDDLEAGGVRQEVLRGMGVGRTDICTTVGRAADDHRDIDETTRHVADAAGVIDDLVEADIRKAPEHELNHWTQAHHGGADAEAKEGSLTDRGVDDALRAETLPETLGDLVGAVVLGDFLTHKEDVLVAGELLGKGVVQSLSVSDNRHRTYSLKKKRPVWPASVL